MKQNEADNQIDPAYLSWVMDTQERVEESPVEELPNILKEVEEEGAKIHKALSLTFSSHPVKLKEAENLTKKLNFVHRIEQTILDRIPVK